MTKPVADILDEAAAVITRQGWYRGDLYEQLTYRNEEGVVGDIPPRECPVCALGAIMVASGLDPREDELLVGTPAWDAALALATHLGALEPGQPATTNYVLSAIADDWNDTDDRTEDDVTTTLRACAVPLRQAADA